MRAPEKGARIILVILPEPYKKQHFKASRKFT